VPGRWSLWSVLVATFALLASSGPVGAGSTEPPPRPTPPVAAAAPTGAVLTFDPALETVSPRVRRLAVQMRKLPRLLAVSSTQPPEGRMSTRIVGGEEIDISEAPWQVSVDFRCGGTLIQARWVMTAAHCVDKRPVRDIRVWSGLGDRREMNSDNALRVVKAKIHPKWNPDTYDFDIALLRLSDKASGRPVRLYHESAGPKKGKLALVSGWGYRSSGGSVQNQLNAVDVTVLAGRDARCGEYGSDLFDPKIMLCAGDETGTVDACQGDSGGPLAVRVDGFWYVAGITSWGVGCASAAYPGVYTRVSRFVPWVHRELGWSSLTALDCREVNCERHRASGLTTGTGYVYRVRAKNSAGWGSWSKPSLAAESLRPVR
jgi:secreted trypsin-like serine protease